MHAAKQLLSKYTRIALDEDKGRAIEAAMSCLEDSEALQRIKQAQSQREIAAINERRKFAAQRGSARVFKVKPQPQQQENISERSSQLSIVERARAIYGVKPATPKSSHKAAQPVRKAPQMENLLNKYISMSAEEIKDPEITAEMKSLKITY